jgi:hypothetical protein
MYIYGGYQASRILMINIKQIAGKRYSNSDSGLYLKVHKIENFFGFDFEFCVISLLVMLKYEGFVKNIF